METKFKVGDYIICVKNQHRWATKIGIITHTNYCNWLYQWKILKVTSNKYTRYLLTAKNSNENLEEDFEKLPYKLYRLIYE